MMIKRPRIPAVAGGAVIAALLTAAVATAQVGTFDDKTYLTFNTPVSLPGKTLPAGKYTFRLADVQGNRHIVQVFDAEESQIFATLLTIPNERLEATGETVIRFEETPADMAPAVKAWFYPGDLIGHEFVYPREQAARIAEASGESVLATEGRLDDEEAIAEAEVVRVDPEGAERPLEDEEAVTARRAEDAPQAETPSPPVDDELEMPEAEERETEIATERQAQAERQPAEPQTATEPTLPQTSSLTPFAGVLGILSLVGAVALGALRRRLK